MSAKKKKIIVAVIILLVAPCLFFLVQNKRHMKRVRDYAKEEKFALAKHELEKVVCLSPKSLDDCKLMMDVYLKNYDLGNVDYIAELCLHKGFKDKTVVFHRTKTRELRGDFNGALGILGAEISSGSGSGSAASDPDYFLTAAQLLTRMNNTQGAAAAYLNVYKLAGDSLQIKFKAVGALVELKAHEQASLLAKNLAGQSFTQPVPYLLLARIFMQLNDTANAKIAYEKGHPLLSSVEEKVRDQIMQNFQDVLKAFIGKKEVSPKK
ncbi:MAG TPA: hypothetical protein DCY86_05065 [Bdellovibrionales bacterium]|nr:hypothetical protein [Bdellovibrionales bacterium]